MMKLMFITKTKQEKHFKKKHNGRRKMLFCNSCNDWYGDCPKFEKRFKKLVGRTLNADKKNAKN